jgi:hypothetical protein
VAIETESRKALRAVTIAQRRCAMPCVNAMILHLNRIPTKVPLYYCTL